VLLLDGAVCDRSGYPLTRTDEIERLVGWPDEGPARVWRNDGGREILVPASEPWCCPRCGSDCAGECQSNNWDNHQY
jgi:hypothetical protein